MNYYYSDILKEVLQNNIVLIPNHYGNIRTYFLNKNNKPMQMFNKCKSSYFVGRKTTIDKLDLDNLIVLECNTIEYKRYLIQNNYLFNNILN